MKIYIAGPMRLLPNLNFPAFFKMEEKLRSHGHTPLNPAIHPKGLDLATYMAMDQEMIRSSHAVLLLPGWKLSRGAAVEVAYARYLSRPFVAFMVGSSVYTSEEPTAAKICE